jgi:hypothetical protein
MDPVSKTDLVALRAQKKIDEKNAYIARLIKDVYAVVTAQARDTDGKYVQWCFARFSNLAEFPNIKDEIVTQLEALFPDCDVKYVLPGDDTDERASHVITVNWDEHRNDPVPDPTPGPDPGPGPVYPSIPLQSENGFD